ncbi:quinone oxidoreductase family protein [Dictyobacter aurantiacus]|uniref:NAD(P)H quinone oxidoreductase n=1 Tax=Dictyobacter aurantiacus TaxID=1936993 RepID=A0A401ZA72_9CHLR|nr:zinc-binding dehydrogenase [Dictyobacter aurantiacus]GCE03771.1 NAD(P)H quinone oxidoreductase [Dictyobacter aurantiacus]
MKAVQVSQFGGPEVLQIQEVADPSPAPNEVLIEVKATTVNRLDLFQRDGSRPVKLPFTPGLEAAGVVLQEGNGFRAGERVLTTRASQARGGGGYASRLAVPAADLARIPEGVSFEQAVAAGLASSTAWGSLFDLGHLQSGERVLIWAGSSGVGSIAIQLARHAGARVITTASSEERANALRQLGAEEVINHRQQNVGKVLQETGGVQLVIELVSATLQESIEAAAADGRIILIGNLGGKEATVDTQAWRLKRVSVIGGGQLHTSIANEEKVLQLIAEKAIQPLIAHVLPVEQAAKAHRLLESGEPQGKIVLTFA